MAPRFAVVWAGECPIHGEIAGIIEFCKKMKGIGKNA